ncbi:MAG: type II toxin-antitoxin system VapC family toxin [Planctomycetales bacterium]
MSYLLDTDTLSAHLRGNGVVTNRFLQYGGRLYLSVVTLAELKVWVLRKQTPVRFRQGLELLLRDLVVLAVDEIVADRAGEVGAELYDRGSSLATPDLLIAATALVHNLAVVTHNVQHLRILARRNWSAGSSSCQAPCDE